MNYASFRPLIKSGDLLAWSHRGWRTVHDIKVQMVRTFTQSEYSHVGIAWVVGGRVFVIEAVVPRVRIYPLSKLQSFYHIGMDAPWTQTTEEHALDCVGSEYSQIQAIKNYFTPRQPGEVSECASLALEILGYDGFNLGNKATPDAVVFAAQKLGKHTLYIENE